MERIIEDIGIYQLRCGRNLIDLCTLPSGATLAQASQRGIDYFCLSIRGDMNEIVEYLAKNGVELASPLRELYGATGFGTSIYILDPDQYMIELKANYSQYPVKTSASQAMSSMTRPPAKAIGIEWIVASSIAPDVGAVDERSCGDLALGPGPIYRLTQTRSCVGMRAIAHATVRSPPPLYRLAAHAG